MNDSEDDDQLRLLSIFHFVMAGIIALVALFPIIHLTVGILMLTGAFEGVEEGVHPVAIVGWMFVIIPATMMIFGFTTAFCVALAGRKIARRTGYIFCLVMAGIECTFMPFGTVLGVFTIIVLMRPTVKEKFGVT